jgi:chemotaxis protein methyltransferase CheR
MYFTAEVMRDVVRRIARSLATGGFLFLGHAETLRAISQQFHLPHSHDTFYYEKKAEEPEGLPGIFLHGQSSTEFPTTERKKPRVEEWRGAKSGEPVKSGEPEKREIVRPVRTRESNRSQALELLREERFGEGIEILREMQEEEAGDADAQLLLAVLLTNRGELTAAETACWRVLEIDEMHAGAHYLIALCREHAGDLAGAVEHSRTAAYLDENFAMPRLHLGRLARRANDLEAARRELGKALQLLEREEASRILLFGGGFTREALAEMSLGELKSCGGGR